MKLLKTTTTIQYVTLAYAVLYVLFIFSSIWGESYTTLSAEDMIVYSLFVLFIIGIKLPLTGFGLYFVISFLVALLATKSLVVSFLAIIAIIVQFFGYGYGFLKSTLTLSLSKKKAEQIFPNLFFKVNQDGI